MAEEQEKIATGTQRFRLPKFFTQGAEAAAEAALNEVDPHGPPQVRGGADARETADDTHVEPPAPRPSGSSAAMRLAGELEAMHGTLDRLSDMVSTMYERESSLEKVFDALHAELADYKNDFLYEHLKPVVRPLLFLFDSLEQFDAEVAMAEAAMKERGVEERRQTMISPSVVRENIRYFRDQLIEALRVCEVTIMDTPRGAFSAKFHKAIDVVPVSQEQDNTIQRVVRSGWFLNGQLLRPAEVVVGKFRG